MKNRLNCYGYNITSQGGEDGIIEYILKYIDNCPNICVEFGAWDGKHFSNTYALWHNKGWTGILIEGDANRCKILKEKYSDYKISIFNKFIAADGEDSLDDLFKDAGFGQKVGVLSIDIDSYDYYVWKNIDFVKPYIVVIEHNETIPGYIEYCDPPGEIFLRSSAKALDELGKKKGYKLIACTETNCIFIKKECFDPIHFPDMPVEFLFDYTHCTVPVLSAYCGFNRNYYPVYGRKTKEWYRVFNRIKSFTMFYYRKHFCHDRSAKYCKPSRKQIVWAKKCGLDV